MYKVYKKMVERELSVLFANRIMAACIKTRYVSDILIAKLSVLHAETTERIILNKSFHNASHFSGLAPKRINAK